MNSEAEPKPDKLDPRVLAAVLILSTVEFEVFTFSKTTVAAAKQDAWLAVILGAVIITMFVYLFVRLAARFPGKGYFEYLKIVWGKPLGTFFATIYLLFWVLFLTALFYETTMANTLLFLPKTPKIVPLLIFAVSLIWLISYGITPIVRFFQLMLPFFLIPLLLLAVLFVQAIDFNNFMPVLGSGIIPPLKGAFYFLGAHQGPEVLLFLAPMVMQIDRAVKPALVGYAVIFFVGWTNTAAAIGILGVEGVKEAVLPGINVVTLLELPGFPVERFGLLLTLPWLIAIFTTMAIYLYLLTYSFGRLFHLRRRKTAIWFFTALPLVISYFLPNAAWHENLRKLITFASPALVFALPVMTLGLAAIRKKGAMKK